ncbi:MAG: MobA/MobL family protein [Bryobacterales bacterium]|nr:MobA/MobL family protein [Bryobacterales bacterium]
MAYHMTAKVVSRAKGDSMVAKAAYNSRTSIMEERTGEVKDYSRHKDKPLASFVFVNAPELRDPGTLWNFYDAQETRKNAQIGFSFIAAQPHELTDEQRGFIVKDFMREQFLRKGVASQADIHSPDRQGDDRNYHVHILASLRKVSKDGLGEKVFTWDDREKNLAQWREKWAERTARELEKAGFKQEAERWRYGHLPQEQQRQKALERGDLEWAERKEADATKHLGPTASDMERKGKRSDRGNLNRAVREVNGLKREMQAADRAIRAEQEKLANPPRIPEDARERGAAMADALSRGRKAANKARNPLERDGYRLWERAPFRQRQRGTYDAAAAYEKYLREHVWGEREREQGGLER